MKKPYPYIGSDLYTAQYDAMIYTRNPWLKLLSDTNYYYPLDDEHDCWHTWKEYRGLTDVYEYCVHCDAKRPVL